MQSTASPTGAPGSGSVTGRARRPGRAVIGGEPSGPLAEIGQNLLLLGISVAVTAAATVLSRLAVGLV